MIAVLPFRHTATNTLDDPRCFGASKSHSTATAISHRRRDPQVRLRRRRGSPTVIGHNIDTQRNDASERYRMLATYGLLAQHDDGYYSLSKQAKPTSKRSWTRQSSPNRVPFVDPGSTRRVGGRPSRRRAHDRRYRGERARPLELDNTRRRERGRLRPQVVYPWVPSTSPCVRPSPSSSFISHAVARKPRPLVRGGIAFVHSTP